MPSKSGYGSKNASTSSASGKPWGSLTKQPKAETLEGPSSGESHKPCGSGKFVGPTKGNRDLPPNRTAGAPSTGHGGGPHKAGGKGGY